LTHQAIAIERLLGKINKLSRTRQFESLFEKNKMEKSLRVGEARQEAQL